METPTLPRSTSATDAFRIDVMSCALTRRYLISAERAATTTPVKYGSCFFVDLSQTAFGATGPTIFPTRGLRMVSKNCHPSYPGKETGI